MIGRFILRITYGRMGKPHTQLGVQFSRLISHLTALNTRSEYKYTVMGCLLYRIAAFVHKSREGVEMPNTKKNKREAGDARRGSMIRERRGRKQDDGGPQTSSEVPQHELNSTPG